MSYDVVTCCCRIEEISVSIKLEIHLSVIEIVSKKKSSRFKLHLYTIDCVGSQSSSAKLGRVQLGPTGFGWLDSLAFFMFYWEETA